MPFIRFERPEPPAKVFDLATPAHVYWKLLWELGNLKRSEADEENREHLGFDSAYHAYNFAVTAWHLVDWVWAASDGRSREHLAHYFNGAPMAKNANLFDAIACRFRAIHVCGQIANGSKHYIAAWREDPSVEAKVLWVQHDDDPKSDDRIRFAFQRRLAIRDGDSDFRPALDVFKEAVRAWDRMLGNWGFIEDRYIGPDAEPPPWA
jgi:hypothetical protein